MYTKGMEIVPGFRLVQLLGRGGFGEVWRASAPGGTDAAIKIISLRERYGFKEYRSLQLVKQLRHPNLVPILAFWLVNEDGQLFDQVMGDATLARRAQDMDLIIAMGLGEQNLLDRLQQCQKEGQTGIPADELLGYMQDSAKAIDFLNQPIHPLDEGGIGGIQHCDIKPQNILIVGGAAQVCDFGLARMLGDARVTSAKGSAAYMAPEIILDNQPSKATDQYCLAISYVELRTGALPLNIASPAAAIWAHAQGKLDLTKLSAAEQTVIRRATSVEPDKRYPTTVEMVRDLRKAIERPAALLRSSFHPVLTLDEMIKPGIEVVPGFKLLKLLGQGGYGQVWEAVAPGGKHIALKIIRNLESTHGKQEFKALELIKGVEHNHLMELHAYWLLDKTGRVIPDAPRPGAARNANADGPPPNTLVIATKLASQNLQQRLKECQEKGEDGIPVEELLGYLKQAAQAIDYLNAPQHQLGNRRVSIQHRDIKPENILLASGVVKVGDFGLAKVVEGTSAVIHGDSAGLTLVYAAPEMFQNLVTNYSDQYSLAVTYFKLRTGLLPFPADSRPNDIIKCHVQGKLDLGRLPDAERAVVARATAVKPEQRYPCCADLVEALDRAAHAAPAAPDDLQSQPTLDFVPPFGPGRADKGSAAARVQPARQTVAAPDASTDSPQFSETSGPPKLSAVSAADTATVRVDPAADAGVRREPKPVARVDKKPHAPSAPGVPRPPEAPYHPTGRPAERRTEAPAPQDRVSRPPPADSAPRPKPTAPGWREAAEDRAEPAPRPKTSGWRQAAEDPHRQQTVGGAVILVVGFVLLAGLIALAVYVMKDQSRGKAAKTADGKAAPERKEPAKKESGGADVATPPAVAKGNPAANPAPVDERKKALFAKADEALDLLALRVMKQPSGNDPQAESLRPKAQAAAEEFSAAYADTPEAHTVMGRLYELQNEPDRARAEYSAKMPTPTRATAEQLPQLLARIEFFLSRKSPVQVNASTLVLYADRAKGLTEHAAVDPALRVRALALGARENQGAKGQQYQRASAQLLDEAKREAEQHATNWRCAYEMARALHELNEETQIEQYHREALRFIKRAEQAAPQEKRVRQLKALIQ
jgi:serine/threonine protein kinase